MMPMVRRIPKRGFNNRWALKVAATNVGNLDHAFENGAVVGVDELRAFGLVSGVFDIVKILGDGELTKKLTVRAHRFSESAKEKIEKAGGTAEVVVYRVSVEEKKEAAKAQKS
jgi:large subunit ribosomal protein L15